MPSQNRSSKNGQHWRSNPPAHRDPTGGADHSAGGAEPIPAGGDTGFTCPDPRAIPYAGIRTGELIGYRLWRVVEEAGEPHLCSLVHRRIWMLGEPMTGDVNEIVDKTHTAFPVFGGVYAFSHRLHMQKEVSKTIKFLRYPFITGTVKMWGEVIEHETGYRAQFAKVNSLDEMHGPGDLDALRARYIRSCQQEHR
jgi:hypothetical protein